MSEALNRLARRGLSQRPSSKQPFRTETFALGLKIDITSIADALDELEQTLTAFQRIATHSRALHHPLSPVQAWRSVLAWLGAPAAWIPVETDRHAQVLGALITKHQVASKLVPAANLAALAVEYGVAVASADTGFARFTEVRWVNPVAAG